jgi:hypothetical protein
LFIALLYLSVSSGLAVEIHHCMGKVEDVSLLKSDSKECGNCGMPKGDNACCKDELKFVKLNDSHKLLDVGYQLNLPVAIVSKSFHVATRPASRPGVLTDFANHSPPSFSALPLFIKHCVFRI